MAILTIQFFPPKFSSHLSNFSSPNLLIHNHSHNHKLRSIRISCSNSFSDASLASELAAKIAKINTDLLQTEEAMKKSRAILFGELCEYLGLREDEAKLKWRKMDEEDKWVLIKGFVEEWGANFHPLSARSAKEMMEEYLRQENNSSSGKSSAASSVFLFSGLKRIMGFSHNK